MNPAMRFSVKILCVVLVAVASLTAFAQLPPGYPADYAQTVAAAKKEGKVVIYSALDTKAAQPLIKDFNAVYPDIKVEYNDMNSTEMYNRFIAEVAAGQGSADVMWSSAMDLQVKLVDDGQAMTYTSPEADRILLLNGGVIEQQGTPQEMYDGPNTLFTADFMGNNNRIPGKVAEVRNGSALLAGEGWTLWGRARSAARSGEAATGMIRLERVRVADGPGENRIQPELTTSMFLGDRWEHVFHLNDLMLRAHAGGPLARGKHWLELPADDLWVF